MREEGEREKERDVETMQGSTSLTFASCVHHNLLAQGRNRRLSCVPSQTEESKTCRRTRTDISISTIGERRRRNLTVNDRIFGRLSVFLPKVLISAANTFNFATYALRNLIAVEVFFLLFSVETRYFCRKKRFVWACNLSSSDLHKVHTQVLTAMKH